MAIAYRDSSQGELVPATPGKIIRVRRLLISSDVTTVFQLKHSTGEVTPPFYIRAGGANVVDLRFDRDAPQTPRGANLELFTEALAASYSVWVEYELVD